ncbi:hypothetical protein [Burkholderia pseudomallei]|uniref:hypothetical protein n=1 Tax=Burkholderia pseudomallei TaxID=28450 RepID=UPI001E53DA5A|nr:hypothetical protein [Burkholderia pseudomallei]
MTQKTVLCYGDSNTHGTRPMTRPGVLERFDRDDRWTGVLAQTLGSGWRIIEEGLPAAPPSTTTRSKAGTRTACRICARAWKAICRSTSSC